MTQKLTSRDLERGNDRWEKPSTDPLWEAAVSLSQFTIAADRISPAMVIDRRTSFDTAAREAKGKRHKGRGYLPVTHALAVLRDRHRVPIEQGEYVRFHHMPVADMCAKVLGATDLRTGERMLLIEGFAGEFNASVFKRTWPNNNFYV